jgi:hypothetical protein
MQTDVSSGGIQPPVGVSRTIAGPLLHHSLDRVVQGDVRRDKANVLGARLPSLPCIVHGPASYSTTRCAP